VTSAGGSTKIGGSSAVGGSAAGGSVVGGSAVGGSVVGGSAGGVTSAGGTPTVTGLPAQSAVLASMRSANDWFMKKYTDPGADIVTDKTRSSNLWTRATYYEGLLALYNVETDATKKTSYYSYGTKWGDSHSWALYSTPATNADNQACGQAYIELYNIGVALGDKQANRIAAIQAGIDSMVSSPPAGTSGWWWIDAIHMSMPSFAKLGVLTGNTKYYDGMWTMYSQARNTQGGGLWNATDGLWFRDLHYTPSGGTKTPMTAAIHNNLTNGTPDKSTDAYYVAPNGQGLYWSRGNGWVTAALVRVLDVLPTTDSHRAAYVADFQAQMKALIAIQRTDGFWNESLMDPTHCATIGLSGDDGPEESGTAFFTYGLAWGIRKGLLDSATYSGPLQKAWNGLSTVSLQSDGMLGYTQSSGDRPCTEDPQKPGRLAKDRLANFDDYGVGGFLLAGSEVYQLAGN
jgi:rhamnogalacturonyl hydrolase YesR